MVAAARALEAAKPNPLAVDQYAEVFTRAVGGVWADVLDGEAPEHPVLVPSRPAGTPRIVVVDRPGSVQSALRVGTPGLSRRDPEYIPLLTINTLFGGYFNSRINNNLRERNGYTYGARSLVDAPLMPGTFSVAASVGTAVTDLALGEIFNELAAINGTTVSDEELEMVKNYIIGSQALQIETPGQVASFVRAIALYDLPSDYYERFPAEVRHLTNEFLRGIAGRYMAPERMVSVVAGDAAALRGKLERFGPLRVVDEKGAELAA